MSCASPDFLHAFDFSLVPRDEKILVACSGGGDSLALLLALHDAEYSVVAAHINHNTRGDENLEDEKLVRDCCEKLQISCACTQLKLNESEPNEAVLRDARYNALLALAREYSCANIATGHTADDALETLLLNWLRGATVAGLGGIPAARELAGGVHLVRPMLACTRKTARDYLTANAWQWREDSSNHNTKFLRNRVRHELLPVFDELLGDGSTRRLAIQSARAASIWRDDVEYLENAAQDALEELLISRDVDLLILDGTKFRDLNVALQRRVLRRAAHFLNEDARDLSVERVEEVRRHINENGRRAVWQWKNDLRVDWTGEYSGNRIRFMRV